MGDSGCIRVIDQLLTAKLLRYLIAKPMNGVVVFGAGALGGDSGGGLDFFPGEAVVVLETDDLMG